MVKGKRHFHHVIAFEPIAEKTRRGNPLYYWVSLGCGHKNYLHHCARTVVLGFSLEIAMASFIKEGKVDYTKLPRMHCWDCIRGKAHTSEAIETDEDMRKP